MKTPCSLPRVLPGAMAGLLSLMAHAGLNVVATTPDLGAIAREIGGPQVAVTSLASGTEDPHFVDAKPSFIRVLNKADVLIEGGAELEIGWLPPLVNNARNAKILGNEPGHVMASRGVPLLEVPTTPVDRSQGDVHPLGNPHFLLDPANDGLVAASLARAFSRLDPGQAATYESNLKKFEDRLRSKMVEWDKALAPFRGTKVVTYHKAWDYLLHRYGFELVGTIEPKPGIEPSPTHINALIPQAKEAGVKLILIAPCRPRKTPEQVARSIGARVLVLPLMPGGTPEAKDVFSWFDALTKEIAGALREITEEQAPK